MNAEDIKKLQDEYNKLSGSAERFREELVKQLHHLVNEGQVRLAVPVESRTKTWNSLHDKLKNRDSTVKSITDLPDLIGVRVVLLFSRDLKKVCELLEQTFMVMSKEDTAARLTENQFGYASLHYIIRPPDEWFTIPSLRGLSNFTAEIQVRTAAQHIWAASSHVLQYKQEAGVPEPLRRTIHRISALLEIVDLEFDRILKEKDDYIATLKPNQSEPLNVNSLERVLGELWPARNRSDEDFSKILEEMISLEIKDTASLRRIIEKHKQKALDHDKNTAAEEEHKLEYHPPEDRLRIQEGYFYNHTGLTRYVLSEEFGDAYKEFRREIWSSRHAEKLR